MNLDEINIGSLAYLGDSVYEVMIRKHLILGSKEKSNTLQKKSLMYVSAVSQSNILDKLLLEDVLKEDEKELIKRARNYTPKSKPRYTNIKDYKKATAIEALFGYLYLKDDIKRIEEIINKIIG